MIQFLGFDQVGSIVTEAQINTFIIPVSADNIKEGTFYKAMQTKYQDFETKANNAIQNREPKPGNTYKIKLDSGHTIYLAVFKAVDKFGSYILDIVKALTFITDTIRTDYPALTDCRVLLPLPTSDEIKMSDAFYYPSIIDTMLIKDLNVYLATDGGHERCLSKIEDGIAYYKEDSFKADWMLTLDDIKFVEILATVIKLSHSFKISKSSLVKCYYIAHQNGMYPKLEFYDTEFGKFFRMFLVKCLGLTNHGLLMNTQHYSKAEPQRFSAIIGPNYWLLKHLAYTELKRSAPAILKIAKEIQKDYIESFKDRGEFETPAKQFGNKEPVKSTFSL